MTATEFRKNYPGYILRRSEWRPGPSGYYVHTTCPKLAGTILLTDGILAILDTGTSDPIEVHLEALALYRSIRIPSTSSESEQVFRPFRRKSWRKRLEEELLGRLDEIEGRKSRL